MISPRLLPHLSHPLRSFSSSSTTRYPYTDTYSNEGTVPTYYQSRRKNAERNDVMHHLDSHPSPFTASTNRSKAKIPTEFRLENGEIVHPSGFPVPSARDAPLRVERNRDIRVQTACVLERTKEEAGLCSVKAAMRIHQRKVPVEVELECGAVVHPSGFIPPTPASAFPFNVIPVSAKSPPRTNPRSNETDPRGGIKEDAMEQGKQVNDVIDSDNGELMPELVNEVLQGDIEASMEVREEKKLGKVGNKARPT